MLQEIQLLEEQYRDAHNAWRDAVQAVDELRSRYEAAKELHNRAHDLHATLKEHGFQVESDALWPMVLQFKTALLEVTTPYVRADDAYRLADKDVEECLTRLEAAKKAAGFGIAEVKSNTFRRPTRSVS
ncbi:hypothetical protein [Noviherbaspirillum sp. Root189]|uniref:hypothetical protein n=1 Tax=Noviherbaspirillum sp. Root189 TaxID=1736487 RepID=UPI000708A8D2|nr:hypothetical protein [Noviherbaspirillum sp. Root189]KRB79075.1 hypothetical protein ASE07_05150 [Noviherbaspirillum sp. Root189]